MDEECYRTYHLSEQGVHLRLVRRGEKAPYALGVGDALRHATLQRRRLAHERRAQRHLTCARCARAAQHALQHVRVLRHVVQAAAQLHRLATLTIYEKGYSFKQNLGIFSTRAGYALGLRISKDHTQAYKIMRKTIYYNADIPLCFVHSSSHFSYMPISLGYLLFTMSFSVAINTSLFTIKKVFRAVGPGNGCTNFNQTS